MKHPVIEFKVYFTFCTSKAQFRRSVFYGDFPDCGDFSNVGSLCCDTMLLIFVYVNNVIIILDHNNGIIF